MKLKNNNHFHDRDLAGQKIINAVLLDKYFLIQNISLIMKASKQHFKLGNANLHKCFNLTENLKSQKVRLEMQIILELGFLLFMIEV